MDLTQKRRIFNEWHKLVNMTKRELELWCQNPWRRRASLGAKRAAEAGVYSGLRSLRNITRKRDMPLIRWGAREFREAAREIAFNTRMLGVSPGRPVTKNIPMSRWEISLRNWGHDPRKDSSTAYDKINRWWRQYFGDKKAPSSRAVIRAAAQAEAPAKA